MGPVLKQSGHGRKAEGRGHADGPGGHEAVGGNRASTLYARSGRRGRPEAAQGRKEENCESWLGEARSICWQDLAFSYAEVPRYSNLGTPFPRKVEVGMPRIPDQVLRCVFFLYASKEDAERGEKYGGTGFLVLMKPSGALYGVTNHHVAVKNGFSVIKITNANGETEILDFDSSEWEFIPGGDDVAAIEMPERLTATPTPRTIYQRPQLLAVDTDMFATESAVKADQIGPGEDVFMIGRFVDHEGIDADMPTVRFGNISAMPAPIEQPNGTKGSCYTIDMHSRSGYSGAPVFAFRTFGQDLAGGSQNRSSARTTGDRFEFSYRPVFRLLGVHCAQFPEQWKIVRGKGSRKRTDEYVEGMSGMTVVVPAASILELLNKPKFANARKPAEQAYQDLINKARLPLAENKSSQQDQPAAQKQADPAKPEGPQK
jgi:hypothetical protein